MRKLTLLRRFSQLFFLTFFFYVLWGATYPLKGLVSPEILFKADPLMIFITSLSERVLLPGLLLSITMIIITLIIGRFFCGWICPLGTVIDITGSLKKKKYLKGAEKNKWIRKIKYVFLGTFVIFALIGIQVAWILDPIVAFSRVVSLNIIPAITLGVNKLFIEVINRFELSGPFYDFYMSLKESFLGVNVYFFKNSLVTLIFFIIICFSSLFISRLWCRTICPLGAMYAFIAKYSLFGRKAENCTNCNICVDKCRMAAINKDNTYLKSECILCMDCIYDCSRQVAIFSFSSFKNKKEKVSFDNESNISRKDFLFLILSSFSIPSFFKGLKKEQYKEIEIIRPPGSLKEKSFLNACIRCGNCMKVCITNGLQPSLLHSGVQGLWTPVLIPEIGYCEYNCTLCGEACPTGAISRLNLKEKHKEKIGLAKVDKGRCIAWNYHEECLVCEEHCPVADKAIKVELVSVKNGKKIFAPVVDKDLCIGCGICQNKCPARPKRAIRVKGIR